MASIRKKQIMASSMATVCLILGSAIYLLFRPMTLLMFYWADALGMKQAIEVMRALMDGSETLVPEWFVFSLPFALWVLAYIFFIEAVWVNSQTWARFIWLWCVPFIAICAELAQIENIIPGKFDWIDLTTIIIAIIIGFSTTINLKKGLTI